MVATVLRPTVAAGRSLLQRRVTDDPHSSASIRRLKASASDSRLVGRSTSLRLPGAAVVKSTQKQSKESPSIMAVDSSVNLSQSESLQVSESLQAKISRGRERRAAAGYSGEQDSMRAIEITRKYGIDIFEVKLILQALDKAPKTDNGSLTLSVLNDFLLHVFSAQSIPKDILDQIYKITCVDSRYKPRAFDLPAFLDWYFCNMFTKVAELRSDRRSLQNNTILTTLCEKHGLGAGDLDKIKKYFDEVDTDKSGFIDRAEFDCMMKNLCGSSNECFSKDRMQSFWREIDRDGNGSVDFDEFTTWYLKYFGLANNTNPAQAFYASFNPSVLRQEFLSNAGDN
eukprot:TRINITY_DN50178_c0_g1_i1.p1 TRINITY_DN50178_c0_g1~~TRINITY_DN50178_c0_g1_i1.p1  ORF type:complete len:350 (+),score=53.63 TRINITY_DN50178_c0_g1_i1:28-1050(+)